MAWPSRPLTLTVLAMSKKSFLPKSPLVSVRADTSIGDCVRLLRDKSIGALVITSANVREDLIGIFTERDLVKNIELIHRGNFWDNPVRAIMTATLRTITVDQIKSAPKIMARYNIRHLPVVSEEKGRKRVIGVISMRDLFRTVMEQFDFDLDKVFSGLPAQALVPPKRKNKLAGVFSSDPKFRELVDKSSKLTKHLIVKAMSLKADLENMDDYLARFEVLVVDLEDMSKVQVSKFLASVHASKTKNSIYLVFNPLTLAPEVNQMLHKLSERKEIHLLAKPMALGLFYEKFIREI